MPDVVSDIFLSESALPADVVLPSAAWADSEGVIANSDARVFKINKAVDAVDHGVVGRLADVSRPIVVTGRDVRQPRPLPRIRVRPGPGATHLHPRRCTTCWEVTTS